MANVCSSISNYSEVRMLIKILFTSCTRASRALTSTFTEWELSWVVVSALPLDLSSGHGVSSGLYIISIFSPSAHWFFRGGAGPRGFLGTLSQYMLSSAATFSFFLAIGSVCCPY